MMFIIGDQKRWRRTDEEKPQNTKERRKVEGRKEGKMEKARKKE